MSSHLVDRLRHPRASMHDAALRANLLGALAAVSFALFLLVVSLMTR